MKLYIEEWGEVDKAPTSTEASFYLGDVRVLRITDKDNGIKVLETVDGVVVL